MFAGSVWCARRFPGNSNPAAGRSDCCSLRRKLQTAPILRGRSARLGSWRRPRGQMPQDGDQRVAEPGQVTGCFPLVGGLSHRSTEVGVLQSCDTVTPRIHFAPQLSTSRATLDLATPRTHLQRFTRIHMDALAGPFSSPVHPAQSSTKAANSFAAFSVTGGRYTPSSSSRLARCLLPYGAAGVARQACPASGSEGSQSVRHASQ